MPHGAHVLFRQLQGARQRSAKLRPVRQRLSERAQRVAELQAVRMRAGLRRFSRGLQWQSERRLRSGREDRPVELQQLQRDGISPTPADNAVLDGIRTVSALMAAGKLKVHRSCKGLLDELPSYSWDEKLAKRGIDAPIKVDDHSADALRYAVRTTEGTWRRPTGYSLDMRRTDTYEPDYMNMAL